MVNLHYERTPQQDMGRKMDITEIEELYGSLNIEVKHPPTTATIKYTDENGNVVRIEELISRKCEYCGCPEGIHESNCLFIIRYCSGHK